MTLPDLLTRAARLMPERVQVVDSRTGGKKALGHDDEVGEWVTLAHWDNDGSVTHARPRDLLALLMQEIEARDWEWSLEGAKDQCLATVYRSGDTPAHVHPASADTPVEALAQALLAALEAQ